MNKILARTEPATEQHLHDAVLPTGAAVDRLWQQLRLQAAVYAQREPLLAPRLRQLAAEASAPSAIIAAVLARRLACADLPEAQLTELIQQLFDAEPALVSQLSADLAALLERDPACPDHLHVLLNLKGFQALQAHRVAQALWRAGRR